MTTILEKKIQILPSHISERIAAGEVIERPSSVVKELIENSLDAGSTEIQVRLEEGGKALIEVLDNGSGMSPEDLELAIQRHATSKLTSLEDLERIVTLGFRGEALPSIAAVSELTLISRRFDSANAYELQVGEMWKLIDSSIVTSAPARAKKISYGQFIDFSHGTLIQARGLFAQVPARLKFLKSQAAEVSQVKEWMEKLAITYPHVGFQFTSNDRTILNIRPQTIQERIKTVLAEGENYPVLAISNQEKLHNHTPIDLGLEIEIFWLQGLSTSSTKKIVQIVNHRALKDRILQQAMMSAFRQSLLPGQFPVVVLKMNVNPAAIDVNVHPTKAEVRFLDQQKIYRAIESLIQTLIQRKGSPGILPEKNYESLEEKNSPSLAPLRGKFLANHSLTEEKGIPYPSFPQENSSLHFWNAAENTSLKKDQFSKNSNSYVQSNLSPSIFNSPSSNQNPQNSLEEHVNSSNPILGAQFIGVLFQTYFLFEKNNELILIDQHAAHERIRYEVLKKRFYNSSHLHSQDLIMPETVRFNKDQRALLEERLEWIHRLGFQVEIFGEEVLLFRSIPAAWGLTQLKSRLMNLIDRVLSFQTSQELSHNHLIFDESLFEKIASEACHSAVRARDSLDKSEIDTLITELFQTEHPWNCPHGRPTVVKIPEGKVEQWFQRKI